MLVAATWMPPMWRKLYIPPLIGPLLPTRDKTPSLFSIPYFLPLFPFSPFRRAITCFTFINPFMHLIRAHFCQFSYTLLVFTNNCDLLLCKALMSIKHTTHRSYICLYALFGYIYLNSYHRLIVQCQFKETTCLS